MSKHIEIKFTWSKDLAIKASKLYYDYDMKTSSKKYIGWLFIALMQFGVVGALKHDSFGLLSVSTFLVIYWYYIRWFLRKNMIVRFYDKSGLDDTDVLFTLQDDGLHYNNDTVIDWEHIYKVVKFDDGILVQTIDSTLFFQREAFNSYEDVQRFIKIMTKQGKV
jgi:hypothetical protein